MNNYLLEKCVLEIGANRGTDTIELYNKYKLPVLAVEPTPELIIQLWQKFYSNQNIHILPLAVDLESGFKKFNIAGQNDWGCSSFYDFNPEIHELWQNRPDFKTTHTIIVPSITGEQIVESFGIKEIEYLWIDTQGNDLRVLKSFKDKLKIVKQGKCEASFSVNLYLNADNHYTTIEEFLKNQGFSTTVVPDSVSKECDIHFKRN